MTQIQPLTIDESFNLAALLTRYHYGLTCDLEEAMKNNQATVAAAHRYAMETTRSMLAIVLDDCTDNLEDSL